MKLYFVHLFIWCSLSLINNTVGVGKFGPYRTSLIRIEKCAKPERPYSKDPMVRLDVEMYNTSTKTNIVKGNLTVLNRVKQFSVKFKAFYDQNGHWSLSRVYTQRCSGLMMTMLLKIAGMEYDSTTCTLEKGSVEFSDIDFNDLDHVWAREREYGRMLWMFQYLMKDTTVICYEAESHINPV